MHRSASIWVRIRVRLGPTCRWTPKKIQFARIRAQIEFSLEKYIVMLNKCIVMLNKSIMMLKKCIVMLILSIVIFEKCIVML